MNPRPPSSTRTDTLCPYTPLFRSLLAAPTPRQRPPDGGHEVAFAGRSNAGKSSALNALCQQKALARVSKTTGRTQQMVFFDVTAGGGGAGDAAPGDARSVADMPGYGYGTVTKDLQAGSEERRGGKKEGSRGTVWWDPGREQKNQVTN